jgi:hypothetical protein
VIDLLIGDIVTTLDAWPLFVGGSCPSSFWLDTGGCCNLARAVTTKRPPTTLGKLRSSRNGVCRDARPGFVEELA